MGHDTATKPMRDRPTAVYSLRERVASCLGERAGSLGRLGVRSVSLVGSLARGEERSDSDVDLLVDLAPDATFDLVDLVTLKEELAAELGREVHILFEGALRAYVAEAVERDIAEALEDLTILTSDLDEAAFKQDRLKRRAAERCIEVISDASSERRPAILVPKKGSAGVQGIIMIPWLCSDARGGTRPLLYAKPH